MCAFELRYVWVAFVAFAPPVVAIPPAAVLQQVQLNEGAGVPARLGSFYDQATEANVAQLPFESQNVGLIAQITPQQFSTNANCPVSLTGVCANDVWGYVSPIGREYAILGLATGTGFVDITEPRFPFIIGAITDANSVWSDMRTYGTYAYNVNESGGGMQIFNLSQIDPPPDGNRTVTLVGSLTASGLQTTHNLSLNVDSGYAYLCGSNLSGGRLVAVSLANPAAPVIAGFAQDAAYVHDAEVITYTEGPYAGREIAFCYCGSSGFKIIDVTNKGSMFTMATLQYPDRRYTHQGRISPDRRYVFLNDELDELQDPDILVTTTRVIDVSNLSSPFLVTTFTSGLRTIDHNLMVRGNMVFEANYTSGLRIFNAADVNNIFQAGWIDTYPSNNGLSFNGMWGVFVDFPSGVVIASDMQSGLFILDVSDAEAITCPAAAAPQPGLNPSAKPRYLSITPAASGVPTALRVTPVSLPPAFGGKVGAQYWADAPQNVPDPKHPGQNVWRSRLVCDPVYLDWDSFGTIEISDSAVVPGGQYNVQAVLESCSQAGESAFSSPLLLATAAVWGDLVGESGEAPPDGQANVLDISAMVDVVKEVPGSLEVPQADLFPDQTDFTANVLDISSVVNGVLGYEYPFAGPPDCP